MKLDANKKAALMYAGLIVSCLFLPPVFTLVYALVFIVTIAYMCAMARKNSIEFLIALPVLFSAIQNVYLGISIKKFSVLFLQILLTINIAIVWTSLFLMIFLRRVIYKKYLWLTLSIVIIIAQSIILFMAYPTAIVAYLSSLRNILAPMTIYYFSISFCKGINYNKLYSILNLISIFVVTFGFVELLIGNSLWQYFNIARLWELKGLSIGSQIVPGNFYSSEIINGGHLRRMASTFADPVNLGSFLFAAFMLSWYRKKFFLESATLAACFFSVSKGAFLGLLIFMIIMSWTLYKEKVFALLITFAAVISALLFYFYSQTSSSGSMNAHISGFLRSLPVLYSYPLGLGVGNVGVLASRLGGSMAFKVGVFETGAGMFFSQLGLLGTVIYIYFFIKLAKTPALWNGKDKTMFYTLTLSFFANAAFNEVALSPNSCAMYFIILGCLVNEHSENKNRKALSDVVNKI